LFRLFLRAVLLVTFYEDGLFTFLSKKILIFFAYMCELWLEQGVEDVVHAVALQHHQATQLMTGRASTALLMLRK
jgi:hypothetical protein